MPEVLPENIINFMQDYGYIAALLTMYISGPVGAIASGFLAGAGVFNPFYIWFLSVFADITTDIFYYELGRRGGRRLLTKLGKFFKWSDKFIINIDNLFHKHGRKTILIVKFTQGIGTITQLMAGIAHMPRKPYLSLNLAGGIIKCGLLVFLGASVGAAWQTWAGKVKDITTVIAVVVLSIILIMIISNTIYKRLAKDLGEND